VPGGIGAKSLLAPVAFGALFLAVDHHVAVPTVDTSGTAAAELLCPSDGEDESKLSHARRNILNSYAT
jgi:hypothetical protein